ncbi:MAG: TetR/AcrR family transcriptional regulator [Xanthobacteraceae bacterium]|nr:TetR/AcrR family transcriptional regulator [Xanthobacteraceae bacterium]
MAYRRTEKVVRRLAERHAAIVSGAQALASQEGMAGVQIAPVARRAGIAAGTVYRYFPSKTELVAALVAAVSEQEISRMRRAADAAPGPLSALAAALATFAARALRDRHLAWAVLAEPVDAGVDKVRIVYRKALAAEIEQRLAAAMARGQLPSQDTAIAAAALVGALLEGLVGPLAPPVDGDPARLRDAVQAMTLFALRSVGIVDAHARGLVVQTVLPRREEGAVAG